MHLTDQSRAYILSTTLHFNKVNVMIPDDVYLRKAAGDGEVSVQGFK